MANITVSAGTIPDYQGADATLKLRIYCRRTFTPTTGGPIIKGAVGSEVIYKEIDCTVLNETISYDGFTIASTIDGAPNNSYYTFALFNDAGEFVQTVYKRIIVPPTPTTTTLEALGIYSDDGPPEIDNAAYALLVTLIESLFAALTRATTVIFGTTSMSHASAVGGSPVSMEQNDPYMRSLMKTKVLDTYGNNQAGVNAAITAIGSTPTVLEVTDAVNVTSNTTFHANTLVVVKGNGAFSVDSGDTLTLTLDPATQDQRPVFSGLGNVVVRGSRFKFDWWADKALTNHNWAYDQWYASSIANGGADLLANSNAYYVTDKTIPPNSWIYGSGNDVDGVTGTRWKLQDLAGTSVLGASEAFRGIGISRCSIDRLTSTTARSFWARGTYPNSAFTVMAKDVTFRSGVAVNTLPILHHDSLPGASTWETISNVYDQCCIFVGEGQTGFGCDTTNSNFTFISPKFFGGVGSKMISCSSAGWIDIITPDWRRIPGGTAIAAPTTTTDRSVTGSITGSTSTLTLTVGAFNENDIGQVVFRTGDINARIVDLVSSTVATVEPEAFNNIVAQAIDIKYFNDNATLSECCIEITGSLNSLTVQGGADEGFNYFLKVSNPTLFGPISIRGATIQSKIHMAGSRFITVEDCTLASQTFSDEAAAASHLFTRNSLHDTTLIGAYSAAACVLLKARNWGVHEGGSVFHVEDDIFTGHPDFGHGARAFDRRNHPTRWVNAGIQVGHSSPTNEDQIEFGQYDQFTQTLLNKYTLARQNDPSDGDGRARFVASQTTEQGRYTGLDCNFDASFTTVNLGQETFTVASDSTFISETRAFVQRLTSAANRTLHGFVSMEFDRGYRLGELKLFKNVGNFVITLSHDDPLVDPGGEADEAPANYRFHTQTETGVPLYPGDEALVYRDNTLVRWQVVKLTRSPLASPLAAQLVINNNGALANTNLQLPVLQAGGIYKIELAFFSTGAVKSLNLDFAGTATFTDFRGVWESFDPAAPNTGNTALVVTAPGTDYANAGMDTIANAVYRFRADVVVNVPGTFILRAAQRTADVSNTTIERSATLEALKLN